MARVRVSSQPAVMVVSTGDELIEPGDPITDYQVRRSNAYAVAATLRRRGFARVGDDHVLDDESMLQERLALHLTTHEVLILSGGVSMGKFDLVPKVLAGWVSSEVFHNIAQRPGKPMWFGIGPQGQVGVRLARQSGIDARVPQPLRDSRDRRGDGDAAPRSGAHGARGAGDVTALAHLFSAGLDRA